MASQVHCVDGMASRPAPTLQSVPAFCSDNGISRSLFYRLVTEGRGPRLTKIARRTLISSVAAAEWRARMEQETEQASARPRSTEHPGRRVGRERVVSRREAA
jgi:predicted DNA-binding transcriptional regulator AlpA